VNGLANRLVTPRALNSASIAHVADLRSRLRNVRQQGIYPAEVFSYNADINAFRWPD
jgi:hypothetical protein